MHYIHTQKCIHNTEYKDCICVYASLILPTCSFTCFGIIVSRVGWFCCFFVFFFFFFEGLQGVLNNIFLILLYLYAYFFQPLMACVHSLLQFVVQVEADEHIFKFLQNKFSGEETRYKWGGKRKRVSRDRTESVSFVFVFVTLDVNISYYKS